MRATVLAALTLLSVLGVPTARAQDGHLFVTIPAVDFAGGVLTDGWSRYCEAFCPFAADARLPHGARVVGLEIDGCRETSADAAMSMLLVQRLPNDAVIAGQLFRVLVQGEAALGCGYSVALAEEPIVVDLFSAEYLVAVLVGEPCGLPGFPACPDEGTRFQAVRVYYDANPDGGVVEPSKRSAFSPF